MKTLSLFIFSIILSVTSFSQVMIIQVNEVQSFVGFSNQTLSEVMDQPFEYGSVEKKDCRYILNLNQKTVEFYRDGDLVSEGPLMIQSKNGIQIVNFLNDGFDYGLIINPDITNESVTLFQYYEDKVEYMNFTDFEIVKSM